MFQLQIELGSTSIYYEQYYPHLNVTKINIKKKKKSPMQYDNSSIVHMSSLQFEDHKQLYTCCSKPNTYI